MDYSRFYTPPAIASLLISELKISAPDKIVDICCGSCNLLNAARRRWKKSELYGADIAEHSVKGVRFEKIDGRQFAINHANEFSLVVANPPFDFVKTQAEFPEVFQGPFEKCTSSRLEVEMLLANLLLLKQDGILLIILPSSFVEASSYKNTRKIIAKHYYVKNIIKLTEDTFGSSLINSYALIIKKCLQNDQPTDLGNAIHNNSGYKILYNSQISKSRLISGNWVGFQNDLYNKRLNIKRGNISSASFISRGRAILHTAKRSDTWQPSIRYISKKIVPTVYAENGDILVSRIGKSAGQWCRYTGNKTPISDCLYCIKDPEGKVFDKINGRVFDMPQKGVATRYITMEDFEIWLNSDKKTI